MGGDGVRRGDRYKKGWKDSGRKGGDTERIRKWRRLQERGRGLSLEKKGKKRV